MRLTVAAFIGALSVASLALGWALTSGHAVLPVEDPRRFAFFSTMTRSWEFGAGVLLALAGHRLARFGTRAGMGAGVLGAALVLFAGLRFDAGTAFPGLAATLPVGGTALMIVAGAASSRFARPLEWRPLTWLGDRSYSWYLWHWPCIVFARVLWPDETLVVMAAAVLSLAPAATAYALVEQPIRARSSLIGWRVARLGLACVAVPLLVGAAVGARADAERADDVAATVERTDDAGTVGAPDEDPGALPDPRQLDERTAAIDGGCLGDPGGLEWPGDACTFGPDDGEGTVLLLGDSKAAALADVVTDAAAALDRETAVWTRAACPFLVPDDYVPADCADWEQAAFDLVATLAPDVVVVSNRTPNETTEEDFDFWTDQLDATIDRLAGEGVPVLVISDSPELPGEPMSALTSLSRELPMLEAAEASAQLAPMLTREKAVVATHVEAALVDPAPHVCDPDCRAAGDGSWWYFDALHFTPYGAARLLDPVRDGLADLLS